MSDLVIIDGDTLSVIFGPTIILAAQGPQSLTGSSRNFFVKNSPVCWQGDEIPPSLRGLLDYTEGAFSNPGKGTLAVFPETSTVLKDGGAALLLKGTQFRATFTVSVPATNSMGVPDPISPKSGSASFATTNSVLYAS